MSATETPRAFGPERIRGQVFPIAPAGIDERAKRCVLARTVRAQGHEPAAQREHRQRVGDVLDVGAGTEGRVQSRARSAQAIDLDPMQTFSQRN